MTQPLKDQPAFPLPKGNESVFPEFAGLTKREHFALEFAKALTVNAGRNGYSSGEDKTLFRDAILAADSLLAALEAGA